MREKEMITKTPATMSEFWTFLAETDDGQQYELINGEIIVSPAPQVPHQRVSMRLILLIDKIKTTGEVWHAPTQVKIDGTNSYQPDLFWIADDNTAHFTDKQIIGVPNLVVEILSPSTAKHDKETKFKVYEKAGVIEYWIVDVAHKLLDVFQHDGDRFVLAGSFTDGDTFQSKALGVDITLNEIFT